MQGRQHPSRDAQKLERLGKAVGDPLLKGVSCHVREGGACVICTLKQTFSIAEIEQLIASQIASFETAVAYDYYCDAFEDAVRALFGGKGSQPCGLTGSSGAGDFERDLVKASTAAVAYTLYIKASLLAMDLAEESNTSNP